MTKTVANYIQTQTYVDNSGVGQNTGIQRVACAVSSRHSSLPTGEVVVAAVVAGVGGGSLLRVPPVPGFTVGGPLGSGLHSPSVLSLQSEAESCLVPAQTLGLVQRRRRDTFAMLVDGGDLYDPASDEDALDRLNSGAPLSLQLTVLCFPAFSEIELTEQV